MFGGVFEGLIQFKCDIKNGTYEWAVSVTSPSGVTTIAALTGCLLVRTKVPVVEAQRQRMVFFSNFSRKRAAGTEGEQSSGIKRD